jgi:hypothetical protein
MVVFVLFVRVYMCVCACNGFRPVYLEPNMVVEN